MLSFPCFAVALLCTEPLCLRVHVPGRVGECEVVMIVDVRMGTVGVGVEPRTLGEGMGREVGEVERAIVLDAALPGHLSRLQ